MGPVNTPTYERIGVIGDVHAQDQRLATAIDTLLQAGADVLLCTGDLSDGDGDLTRCCELITQHNVLCVRGNHDRWLLDDRVRHVDLAHHREDLCATSLGFLQGLPTQRRVRTCEGDLLLCHGVLDNDLAKIWPGSQRMPAETDATLDALIQHGQFRWLINGHMHYRVVLDFPGLTLINAGTLNPGHRPGVSLLDIPNNDIQVFEFGPNEPTDIQNQQPLSHELYPLKTVPLMDDTRPRWRNSQDFDGSVVPHTLY